MEDRLPLSSTVLDGAKLILFLRHDHNCSTCQADPDAPACPNERHVSVIIAENVNKGQWDLRAVGGGEKGTLPQQSGIKAEAPTLLRRRSSEERSMWTLEVEIAKLRMEKQRAQETIQGLRATESALAKNETELKAVKAELKALKSATSADEVRCRELEAAPSDDAQQRGAMASPTTTDMLETLTQQVEQLQQKMDDEVRRTTYCSVCFSKPFVWVFECGHAKCDDCAVELKKRGLGCPECREPLNDPRRLFWAACG